MDGKDAIRRLRHLLGESANSTWLDERTSYDYLYQAAREWTIQTECLSAEQEITTEADVAGYTLNGDFLALYLKHDDEYYIKYTDEDDNDTFPTFKEYTDVIYENDTTSVAVPSYFTLIDDTTLDTLISDTADNAADDVGGKATLTMNTEVFTDVTEGDIIHNTTDESDGIVTYVSSTKIIETCLFGGTDNEWDANDAFIIQPRKRLKIQLVPPPTTADETVTVYYLRKPRPVYSDYDVYLLAHDYEDALVKYAAWLYKYRDDEPDFGNAWYQHWQIAVRDARRLTNRSLRKDRSFLIPKWSR